MQHSRGPALPVRWRLLDTAPAPGAWNMAVDEALAASVAEGGAPVLRVYRWDPPCLSLGRNQPARGRYNLDALATAGIEVVRRPTGGRAVLHWRELTYCVAAPEGMFGGPRRAYAAINAALVAGLRRLGVEAAMHAARSERAPAPSLSPCFATPVEGEVVALGRKLVGSAQRRLGTAILQHGSLPIEDDQSAVAGFLLERGDADPAPPPATLSGVLGRAPAWDELVSALAAGWEEALGAHVEPDGLSEAERAHADAGAARYADPAWTWHL